MNLYDTLRDVQTHRRPASDLTGCWQRLGDMEPHMLNFLENHDEHRFASKEFAGQADLVTPSLVVASTIGTGAMMVYFGQELGEKGEDAEGYSGHDGRTTIFDYWSIPTLRRWLNGGRPALKNLDPVQRWLRERYATVLNLCDTEPAINSGSFFDLMYVNYNSPGLDPTKVYTYLRHSPDETLLIAVNFADGACKPDINIPAHAFDCLDIKPGSYEATDLLTGDKSLIDFTPETPVSYEIRGYDAIILRLTPAK